MTSIFVTAGKGGGNSLNKVAPLSRLVADRLWLSWLGGISKVHTYCGSAHGCTVLTGNYDHHLDDEKDDLHSEMIKMTVI